MYRYEVEKPKLFTEHGLVMYVKIRDNVRALLAKAGAVSAGCAIREATGDTWTMLACLDHMVEVGELREITGPHAAGQNRVFV